MYDDPVTPSHDPSESGQDNDSALFKYLSLLGSGANGYRQQLQDQDPPQDASIPDFFKQVRGLPTEEPQNDAMQRLSGLFKSDSPSPDENQGLSFLPRLSRLSDPLSSMPTRDDSYIPRSYSNQSLQSNTQKVPGSTQPPGTLSGSPPTAGSTLPVNPLTGGKLDSPVPTNPPENDTVTHSLQQQTAPNRSNSFSAGAPADTPLPWQVSATQNSYTAPTPSLADEISGTSIEDQQNTIASGRETDAAPTTDGYLPNLETDDSQAATNASVAAGKAAQKQLPHKQPYHHQDWTPVTIPDLQIDLINKEANDPVHVKQFQHLLNLAKIDDPGMSNDQFLREDGKITDQMLQMVRKYQKLHNLPAESFISREYFINGQKKASQTLKLLSMNRLADERWNRYDRAIQQEVSYYNNFFAKKYPGFKPLDPDLVRAILRTEVQGPDTKDQQWFIRPMQIGNPWPNPRTGKKDPAMDIIKNGGEGTAAWVPEDVRQQLRKSEFGEANVRAGVAYLYQIALQTTKTVIDDPTPRHDVLRQGENLTSFANRVGTTVPELYRNNNNRKKIEGKERSLKPGTDLQFTKMHTEPSWDWDAVMPKYNTQTRTKNNAAEVLKNYEKLKKAAQLLASGPS